jgi:acyl-CoA thioester hydrolase
VFRTRIRIRTYELDGLGHVNQAVYHSYAEVARTEMVAAAGGRFDDLMAEQKAPVLLESRAVYRSELRAGEIDVTCEIEFGTGKTFRMMSQILKADGTLSAEITCTLGLMDLKARKLLADPRSHFEAAGIDFTKLKAFAPEEGKK